MEWTDNAADELEQYLSGVRADLKSAGADADEVVDDMRRHIDEELSVLNLQIVTKQDVIRILNRMGKPDSISSQDIEEKAVSGYRNSKMKKGLEAFGMAVSIAFGVVLPIVTLVFELVSGLCKSTFFDPIPTVWHALLIACVPAASVCVICLLKTDNTKYLKPVGLLTGLAIGVALYYSLVFLPLTPFAAIAIIYFGLGFIPLSPLFSFVVLLCLRGRLKRLASVRGIAAATPVWRPILAVFLIIVVLDLPNTIALVGTQMAVSNKESTQISGIKLLRTLGSKKVMLESCYRRSRPITDIVSFVTSTFLKDVSLKERQNIYYRVTGLPYNAVKPPEMRGLRRGSLIDPDDWDFAQGGDDVSSRVKGLHLEQSRMDGIIDADAGTVYTEWTLVFKNDSNVQREARAEIALPEGSVVSRLTLWIDGEEREAAYSGRAKVKAAYKKVVQRRRDPVLVTTSGPDQVLMQCFPVPPNGGTMKTRVGITSPLVLKTYDHGLFRFPYFMERNFGLAQSLHHSVWMESEMPLGNVKSSESLVAEHPKDAVHALRGKLSDEELSNIFAIKAERHQSVIESWVKAKNNDDTVVRQTIEEHKVMAPSRVVFVVDGSVRMKDRREMIAKALKMIPDGVEFGIIAASDSVRELISVTTSTSTSRARAALQISELKSSGGCDNVPALIEAWDLAAASENSAIVWLHATQPIQMQNSEDLLQRWERRPNYPKLYDLQFGTGPNLVAKTLDGMRAFHRVPVYGDASTALNDMLIQWGGEAKQLDYKRWTEKTAGKDIGNQGSPHIERLWVASEICKLGSSRDQADVQRAIQMAHLYQLVTPVSGAVVLENAEQYAEAGLTPANASDSPQVVPEPETWALFIVGFIIMILFARKKSSLVKQRIVR